jgi:hypothetical protein
MEEQKVTQELRWLQDQLQSDAGRGAERRRVGQRRPLEPELSSPQTACGGPWSLAPVVVSEMLVLGLCPKILACA